MEAEIKKKEAEEAAKKAAEEAARKAAAAGKTNNSTAKGNTGSTTTTSTGSSSLRWPCPASGRLTSGYGNRKSPTAARPRTIRALISALRTGSSIVAAAGGTVSIATYSYSAGNYVVVNHGNGLSTVYMHCSQLLVSAGDTGKSRTDDREGRFARIFDRFSSAFCSPQERKLCKPFELCKSVVTVHG